MIVYSQKQFVHIIAKNGKQSKISKLRNRMATQKRNQQQNVFVDIGRNKRLMTDCSWLLMIVTADFELFISTGNSYLFIFTRHKVLFRFKRNGIP